MNVFHIINSIDKSVGGPVRSINEIIKGVNKHDKKINFFIITKSSYNPFEFDDISNLTIISLDSSFFNLKLKLFKIFKLYKVNLIHIHGLWDSFSNISCFYARYFKIPYIVSLRGMLEPWSLRQKPIKKMIALRIYQKLNLKKAKIIHCTSESEAKNFKSILKLNSKIKIIPNGIDTDLYSYDGSEKENIILFISRIHKKKGLDILIDTWNQIKYETKKSWKLLIIGNGRKDYIDKLNSSIKSLNLYDEVFIKKPVYGKEKIQYYSKSKIFVLPTHSENFGNVIGEALSCELPVLTTSGTPWDEINKENCGFLFDLSQKNLQIYLEKLMSSSDNCLRDMGKNGRKLILNKFSSKISGKLMIKLYKTTNE